MKERRLGIDRRRFDYTVVIPEKREGDRRKAKIYILRLKGEKVDKKGVSAVGH